MKQLRASAHSEGDSEAMQALLAPAADKMASSLRAAQAAAQAAAGRAAVLRQRSDQLKDMVKALEGMY